MASLYAKDINIRTRQIKLSDIIARLKEGRINIRAKSSESHWSYCTQARFIESILIQLPMTGFCVDGKNDKEWLIIDGAKRLNAIHNFVVEQTLVLYRLEYRTELNGKRFAELPSYLRRRITEYEVTVYTLSPGMPDKVRESVIRRMNPKKERK